MHNRQSIRNRYHGNQPRTLARNGNLRHSNRQTAQLIQSERYINQAVESSPKTVPVVQHTFADFHLQPSLIRNILAHGYQTPTPIQDQAMPFALRGCDVVGLANTGTGKTAAFLVPLINKVLLNRKERVLILCPTRELAIQITDELKAFTRQSDVTSVLCIGGASMHNQIALLKRQPDFVVATPGRLKDLIEHRCVSMQQYTNVVLDEVDRMVDIGFIKDIRMMLAMLPLKRQSLFFSATITPDVSSIIKQFATDPMIISVKTQDTAETVDQDVIKVADPNKKFEKLTELLRHDEFSKVIIFGRTKWGVEKLARNLDKSGFKAASIHGNKSQSQRQQALTKFKQDHLNILVATDIAARGLDIPNVSHVINYDEPATYDDYIHRIGRTGRANQRGKALTFVSH